MEAVHSNFLLKVEPRAEVSRSEKLEHGKSRALYACDTVNYFHFDAPCTEVERVWAGRRAVLRPTSDSDFRDFRRRAKRLQRFKIMLDFEDFNSAHTLEAQRVVVQEVFKDLDARWLRWLDESISNMWVRDCTGDMQRVRGTLMSGHRMTSMVNTILNAAYMRLVLGDELYLRCITEHVGDDIVITTDSSHDAQLVVERALSSRLRFQRSK